MDPCCFESMMDALLAAKVAFSSLNLGVSQEELDLFQLTSRSGAEPSTGPIQIVRREFATPRCKNDSFVSA
jgi:hypothetical protein